ALAELRHVHDRADRAPDQPLDLLGPAAGPAALAAHACVGGARQHAVLRGHPALPLALEEGWHFLLERCSADDLGVAELDEHRALRMPEIVARDDDAPELIGRAAVMAGPRGHVVAVTGWPSPGRGAREGGAQTLVVPALVLAEPPVDRLRGSLSILRGRAL